MLVKLVKVLEHALEVRRVGVYRRSVNTLTMLELILLFFPFLLVPEEGIN